MPGVGRDDRGAEFEFLDAFSQAALMTDLECRLVYVNAAAERMLGRRSDELLGQRLPQAAFSENHRDAFREVSELVLLGHTWQGELSVLHGDGSTVQAEITCTSLRRDDRVVGLVSVMSEVGETSEQGRSAQRLAERLTGLARVNAELAVADDLETVTKVVISEAADAVGATVGSLSLLVDGDTLALAGLRGGSEGAASRWTRYSVHDQTPAGDVARSGVTHVLVGRDALHDRYPQTDRATYGERSMIA